MPGVRPRCGPCSQSFHASGKSSRVFGGVFAARVLIAFINMKVVVTEILQALGEELSVGQGGALIESEIISGPAPPADQRWQCDASMMEIANNSAVSFELRVIIGTEREHDSFGRDV